MRQKTANELRELALDIESELASLTRLEQSVQEVRNEIQKDPAHAALYYENLALKLHNFYTGCEHIFELIASELNGALPSTYDWHKRLLDRMKSEREGRRAILQTETARRLEEFLAFRHIVRNLYGFELNPERVERLVEKYPDAWGAFESDLRAFLDWLRALAAELDKMGE